MPAKNGKIYPNDDIDLLELQSTCIFDCRAGGRKFMGDEYTWLVGQDESEKVKAFVTKEDEEENMLVNTLKNEDISADLYSEFVGLQERMKEDKYNQINDDINDIKPYVDPGQHTSPPDDHSNSSSTATHSLMDLTPTASRTEPPQTVTENIIQLGDKVYSITGVLLIALKKHIAETMKGVEVVSTEGYAAMTTHGQTAGRVVHHHLVSGAAVLRELASVRIICAVIRETCHFTLDRTNLYTKW